MTCEGTNHCETPADFRCVDCGRQLCARHGDLWTACGPMGTHHHRRTADEPRQRVGCRRHEQRTGRQASYSGACEYSKANFTATFLAPSQVAQLVSDLRAGVSYTELTRRYRVDMNRVRFVARTYGVGKARASC